MHASLHIFIYMLTFPLSISGPMMGDSNVKQFYKTNKSKSYKNIRTSLKRDLMLCCSRVVPLCPGSSCPQGSQEQLHFLALLEKQDDESFPDLFLETVLEAWAGHRKSLSPVCCQMYLGQWGKLIAEPAGQSKVEHKSYGSFKYVTPGHEGL